MIHSEPSSPCLRAANTAVKIAVARRVCRTIRICCLFCALPLGAADAQELEPRQYTDLPVGLNFLVAGYALSRGAVVFDPTIQLENAHMKLDGLLVGYARSIAVGRLSTKIDAGIGRICLSGSADYQGERVTRNVCGATDATARLSVNFIGAPALRMPKFAGYRQKLIVGASLQVAAPTGQYDPDRLVNVGTNRWAVKAEIGMSKALRRWLFELALAQTHYQANDDFFGGTTRRQDPILSLQSHAVRNLPSGLWVAVDATYYRGGETTTAGISNHNALSNSRIGVTLSVPVNARQSVKFNVSSGVFARSGTDFDRLGIAWQYRWGGGLPEWRRLR